MKNNNNSSIRLNASSIIDRYSSFYQRLIYMCFECYTLLLANYVTVSVIVVCIILPSHQDS